MAQTIAQAVAAAVTSSVNELTAQFNQKFDSLSETVNKTVGAANTDNNFETSVVGAHDPFESHRRDRSHYDTLNQFSVQALQNAVETANMVSKQAVQINAVAGDRQWNAIGLRAGDHSRTGQ